MILRKTCITLLCNLLLHGRYMNSSGNKLITVDAININHNFIKYSHKHLIKQSSSTHHFHKYTLKFPFTII